MGGGDRRDRDRGVHQVRRQHREVPVNRPAILVENLSVRFRQFVDKKPTLRKALARRQLRETAYVEALNDVSFRVEQGESFGIVGRNRAGTSTHLRYLAVE